MKPLLKQFLRREAHPAIQFIKYGMAGMVATAVDVGLFIFLSLFVIPAMTQDDTLLVALETLYGLLVDLFPRLAGSDGFYGLFHYTVIPITDEVRERNFIINRTIVFMASNFVAYLLNMLWVFTPGRHARQREIIYFYAVAVSSFLVGTTLGWAMIVIFHVDTTQAYVCNLLAAVMINFVCRKYLVFQG